MLTIKANVLQQLEEEMVVLFLFIILKLYHIDRSVSNQLRITVSFFLMAARWKRSQWGLCWSQDNPLLSVCPTFAAAQMSL